MNAIPFPPPFASGARLTQLGLSERSERIAPPADRAWR
jgi:hypothetical protein